MSQIVWPEVFETGKVNYPDTWEGRGAACADALLAWGNCHTGTAEIPHNFGDVIVLIGNFLGISATQENLSEYAKKWHKEKEEN